ncbi:MAG: hypothetical protein WAV05_06265 [Anaerolineales bacterium]
MLKQFAWKRKTLLVLAIILLLSILIISIKTIVVKGQGSLNPPGLPTMDALSTYQMNNDATSTPDATQIAEYSKTVYPTPTKIPISKYTDLSPSLNDQEKFIILVKHSNGIYEQFTVGPLRSYTDLLIELPDYIINELPLQPGDEIIAWRGPAKLHPSIIVTESSTATQSIMIQPTEIQATQIPYPYP